jgi:hypothetical protein
MQHKGEQPTGTTAFSNPIPLNLGFDFKRLTIAPKQSGNEPPSVVIVIEQKGIQL